MIKHEMIVKVLMDEAEKAYKEVSNISEDKIEGAVAEQYTSERIIHLINYFHMLCERIGEEILLYGEVTDDDER